jgi:hypothetical protein
VVVPRAAAALLTGPVVAPRSPWRVAQHWRVLVSQVLTTIAAVVTVLQMPARESRPADPARLIRR